jgi:hypothetical protein
VRLDSEDERERTLSDVSYRERQVIAALLRRVENLKNRLAQEPGPSRVFDDEVPPHY